jgi:hypothetical protein
MSAVSIFFERLHTSGPLHGMKTYDFIRHVDRWHAAQWVKGVRRNSRRGALDYKNTMAFEKLATNAPTTNLPVTGCDCFDCKRASGLTP